MQEFYSCSDVLLKTFHTCCFRSVAAISSVPRFGFGSWNAAGIFNWDAAADEMLPGNQPGAFHLSAPANHAAGLPAPSLVQFAHSMVRHDDTENRYNQMLRPRVPGLEVQVPEGSIKRSAPKKITLNLRAAGLVSSEDHLLFDFWNQKFLGKVRGEYSVLLEPHQYEVISLTPDEHHPQRIGTDRHITMDGVEIRDETWDFHMKRLHVVVMLVGDYPTALTFYSNGTKLKRATASGAELTTSIDRDVVRITFETATIGPREVDRQFR